MAFCPYCGHTLEPNAAYCPACGQKVAATAGASNGPSAPPPYPGGSPNLGPLPSIYGEADKQALNRLWVAFLISVFVFIGSFAFEFVFNPFRALNLVTRASNGTAPSVNFGPAFSSYLDGSLAIGGIAEFIVLLLVWTSFRKLSHVDSSHFRIPSILTIVFLAALPLLLLGAAVIFSVISPLEHAVQQQRASGGPPSFPAGVLGTMLSGLGIMGLGGLIGLVGLIGGLMLGLWRVGGRYDNSLIKISAILIIIPILDIVVPFLMAIGIWQARKKVSALTPPPTVPPVV